MISMNYIIDEFFSTKDIWTYRDFLWLSNAAIDLVIATL